MNWIRENKFLAGFLMTMVVGIAGLGYVLYTAYANYLEVSDKFAHQSREYQRLQNLKPYPDTQNLEKYQNEEKVFAESVATLQKNLSELQFPLEVITPEQFQDRLQTAVVGIAERAKQTGTELPKEFYLGFDNYRTGPPKGEAAAPLARELKSLELAVRILLDNKVNAITALKRTPLPQEQGGKTNAPGEGKSPAGKLVDTVPFEITFIAEQLHLKKSLNELAGSQKQFFIIRNLHIKNQTDKGPLKTVEGGELDPSLASSGGQQPGNPSAPAGPRNLRYVVGTEKVETTLKIDIAAFAAPR